MAAVELDERVDEMASNRSLADELGELGQVEQPVGVRRRPVGIVSVDDPPVDDVMSLRRFVEKLGDSIARVRLSHQPEYDVVPVREQWG